MPLPAKLRVFFKRRNEPKTVISVHSERIVVLVSILLVLLLGLPLWWSTTRVYRAELPAEDIAKFKPIDPLHIPFVFYIDTNMSITVDSIKKIEKSAGFLIDKQRALYAPNEWSVRYQASVCQGAAPKIPGHYTLSIHEASDASVSVDIAVGRMATVFVPKTAAIEPVLAQLISTMVAKEEQEARRRRPGSRKSLGKAAQKHSDRALKYSAEYAVTFTLLNEDPVDGVSVDWDIEQAVSQYIQPFVDALRPLTKLTITSQVLHHAGSPPIKPQRANNYTYLSSDMLTHFVNSPSWNLASTDPISPMLNFMLYVPSLESQPMHIIQGDAHKQLRTNAFLVSQWGGITIANLPKDTIPGSHIVFSQAQMQEYMGAFIAQLREHIGIRRDVPLARKGTPLIKNIRVRQATATGISDWELDALLRQWLVDNRETAITTLQSLTRLVDSMQNMVVMDEIKTKVDQSLFKLGAIEGALNAFDPSNAPITDHLKACQNAAMASTLAESAFFDPSMVSMLYFPDQHKYAIYLPFFLPVALPLLTAIKRVIKARKEAARNSRDVKKTKDE
ncbi:GPI transamidase component [Kickxella alabastrina]|nr:GPI transamidase component [Kickxella alabastrina]